MNINDKVKIKRLINIKKYIDSNLYVDNFNYVGKIGKIVDIVGYKSDVIYRINFENKNEMNFFEKDLIKL